jgi:hypothetical protein
VTFVVERRKESRGQLGKCPLIQGQSIRIWKGPKKILQLNRMIARLIVNSIQIL